MSSRIALQKISLPGIALQKIFLSGIALQKIFLSEIALPVITCLVSFSVGVCLFWCQTAAAGNLPSTVTTAQWRDSFLSKWQSGNEIDKKDAVRQLSALLLLMDSSDTEKPILIDRLGIHIDDNPDALMALAFHDLISGSFEQSSRKLLDLILRFPTDPGSNRFRIALARSFRLDGRLDLASAQLDPLLNAETPDGTWAIWEKIMVFRDMDDHLAADNLLNQLSRSSMTPDYLRSMVTAEKASADLQRVLIQETEME